MNKDKVKRICTNQKMSHSQARKVLKQLKSNPEVCEECKINPCPLTLYVFGKEV